MSEIDTNPLAAAIAAGLTVPIHVKLVGANGTTSEYLFENILESHAVSLQLPINYPIEWALTGANQLSVKFTQTKASTEKLFHSIGETGLN